ncbi:MAG TPA: hypothetical protein VMH87_03595, partial [Pseudomonadales bacterium]|nr:hypothetical protein [Pseudomonadales bacterium]
MKHFSYWCMAVLFLIPFVCDGQLNGVDLSAIEATTPLTADQMPIYGTFYSAAHPLIPPLPANIWGLSGWSLDNGYYLLDDLDDSSGGGGFHAMAESAPFPPGYYGGGSNYTFTSSITPYVFPTNGLWLWITNVTNGTVYANLNGATDYVYEVFSTQNLLAGPPVSNWSIETEVFPGVHTNTMPFTVPTAGRNPLFVWARDWTGITSNGNTTPDWWFWLYFKTTDLLDTDPDSQGSTLVSDYLSKTDPNVINFLLNFTNYYSGTANISAFVGVQHGIPFYQAVLINDTNTADAVWQSCTGTNVPVTLGSTNGLYTVNVGLRGFPASGTQTWKSGLITLYFNAPAVDIINPTSTIVYEPSIRIQGYANHVLGSVIFDISNAAGIYANQSGFLTGQFYDTNSINDTTNYFECDPNLSVGTNFITLHAIDWAGNSTNIHLTLDYIPQTNASVINILWPQSGMAISGSNFTVQAQVENAVSIKASITDTNGATDTVQGLIEDNGTAWVQNLPLSGGTNIVTVIATGQDGTMVITNLNVVENDVGLYVFPLNTFNDQLNQSSVTVNGQINDPSLCVYVNGVKANYTDDFGDWEADQVPVSPYGTAVLSVQVYEGDPVLVASQNYYQPQPVAVGMMSYSGRHDLGYSGPGTETINWDYLTGGKYTPIPSASY